MLKKRNSGFTLVEILIVIILIGILVVIALPQYEKVTRRALVAEAYSTLGGIKKTQALYYHEAGTYSPHIYWGGKYWLDIDFPPKFARHFDYGVSLTDANGNPDETMTESDYYIAVARRDTADFFFPECPHIHETGEPGIYVLDGPDDDGTTPKSHSHGDITHSHRIIVPDAIP